MFGKKKKEPEVLDAQIQEDKPKSKEVEEVQTIVVTEYQVISEQLAAIDKLLRELIKLAQE